MGQSTSGSSAPWLTFDHPTFPRKAAQPSAKAAAQAIMCASSPAPLVPHLTLDNLPVCAFFLGLEDRMTLDLLEAHARPGASSPDPSMVIADISRGIGQGQLAASECSPAWARLYGGGTSVSPYARQLQSRP
jgi:hypothetical protein